MARHAHITQNTKVAISLQNIKKEMGDEIGFLHVDKEKNFLQNDTMIFDADKRLWSNIPKVAQISGLQCLYNISKNKSDMTLIFNMQKDIKVSYKFISILLASKFPTSG